MTDELTDRHAAVLEWLEEQPTGSLQRLVDELGAAVGDVAALVADLIAAGMLERAPLQ